MKRTALALLMLASLCSLRADTDILVNSDFSDGRAHWKGDVQDPDTGGSSDLGASTDLGASSDSSSGNTAGVVIKLKQDQWTKIFQNFTVRSPKLFYTVTYKLSADYKQESTSYQDTSSADFGDVPGINGTWDLCERYWYLMLPGGNFPTRMLQPDLRKKGQQMTLTGHLNGLTTDFETSLLLAFPPGQGTVTLYKVQLTNTDPNADP
jgi:hypothetical protein